MYGVAVNGYVVVVCPNKEEAHKIREIIEKVMDALSKSTTTQVAYLIEIVDVPVFT